MRVHIPERHASNPVAYVMSTHAEDIVRAGINFSKETYSRSSLSLREFEAARTRTAQINGCVLCKAWRSARDVPGYLESLGAESHASVVQNGPAPDEMFYQSVSNWQNTDLFSERERIAIEYAELMGLEPNELAYNEDFWRRAKAIFTDNELVDLSFCLAAWIGLGRAIHVLGLDNAAACQIS
ncbi:carboxymuconolactone decarboxylase family protein [Noviherbaspirillum sedimenti]|uniref:Carboxymuconolactone decarboxylase family protein n=1 Tax=Noviherbaspirillum sedimenti TaxID=2320865 RepID=A0A3A3GK68_9BURK|nr:carboxymuconolactone decarboxylase family protein [Noviherbaspirillum sedimenti]RJG01350.1 carboxymuconolactone decarboxylase family protein [Noviherbaspirillum sedimenti]